jgi:hypothetical protein
MLKIENDKEDAMVDLVLKAEQIRLVPREVKEWIRSVVLAELELAPGPERGQDETAEAALVECTVEEAGLVLEHIRDDYLAAQVFLELGRDTPQQLSGSPELHRIPVTDILRHTRLGDTQHLAACLDRIAQAFRAVRRDPSATLFAFDRMGGLYVHDTTRQSVKALWQALVTSRLTPAAELPGMAFPPGPSVPLDARLETAIKRLRPRQVSRKRKRLWRTSRYARFMTLPRREPWLCGPPPDP